jgi:hypothetical protein
MAGVWSTRLIAITGTTLLPFFVANDLYGIEGGSGDANGRPVQALRRRVVG